MLEVWIRGGVYFYFYFLLLNILLFSTFLPSQHLGLPNEFLLFSYFFFRLRWGYSVRVGAAFSPACLWVPSRLISHFWEGTLFGFSRLTKTGCSRACRWAAEGRAQPRMCVLSASRRRRQRRRRQHLGF